MLAVIGALTLLLLGHGSYSAAYQPEELPNTPQQLAVGTTFGLLLSNDDGGSWTWICDEAIQYGQGLNPAWHFSQTGAIFAGSFRGLFRSTDRGCTWASHPHFAEPPDGGQGTGVGDLRSNGTFLFATTSKYGVVNTVSRSMDDGVSWTPTSIASAEEFYSTVRTAPSRPQRVYVAGWWFRPQPTASLYWSDDSGDTFTRVDITGSLPMGPARDGGMGPLRGAFYVHAVDPNDPDTIYGLLNQDDVPRHSFAIRSRDRGVSWTTLVDSVDQISGLALSADGKTVWVATATKVLKSTDSGGTFAPLQRPTRFSCVSRFGDRIYVCGWNEVDRFAVARSTGSGAFEPILAWERITGVASCPGTAVESVCGPLFPGLVAGFPKLVEPDPMPQDAGTTTPMEPPPPRCGCAVDGGCLVTLAVVQLLRMRRSWAMKRR